MRTRLLTTMVALLTLTFALQVAAGEVTWLGAGTKALDTYGRANFFEDVGGAWDWQTGVDQSSLEPYGMAGNAAVNGYDLWDNGSVPGAGDTARFHFQDGRNNFVKISGVLPVEEIDVIIDGDDFDPDHIILNSYAYESPLNQVYLDKDLELESVYVRTGYTSNSKSYLHVMDGRTLTVTGEVPMTFVNYGLNSIILTTASSTLRLHGPEQLIGLDLTSSRAASPVGGTGIVEFTYPGAEITLLAPGKHTVSGTDSLNRLAYPAFSLVRQRLRVRSDQTWINPDGTAGIHFPGSRDTAQINTEEPFIEAIDEERLDNLGNVPFYFTFYASKNYIVQVPAGTYQSFHLWTRLHYTSNKCYLKLIGNVNLAGGTVLPGQADTAEEEGFDASQSDYSVFLDSSSNYTSANLNLNGYNLKTTRGILMQARGSDASSDYARALAEGSIFDIGGDLVMISETRPGGNLNGSDELDETRNIGIWGDEDTVLTLRGSFITNVRSGEGDGLHLSTVNLLGGSAEEPNTFEVGSDPADEVEAETYAINILNVGSETDAGFVRLVNEYINDGDPLNTEKDGQGEALVVNSLTIAADSLLNAGGQGVKICESLEIDPAGGLDLNTTDPLDIGDKVTNFVGVGDQVDDWNASRISVSDSSNPGYGFKAVLHSGNTYWMATAGNSTLLLVY